MEDVWYELSTNIFRSYSVARISGVNVPVNKPLFIALTYIFGIGHTTSVKICTALNIPQQKRVKDLTDDEINQLRAYIDKNVVVEGDLRRVVIGRIKALKDEGSYRGMRHRAGLPCRGQNTHSNAKTARKRAGVR